MSNFEFKVWLRFSQVKGTEDAWKKEKTCSVGQEQDLENSRWLEYR